MGFSPSRWQPLEHLACLPVFNATVLWDGQDRTVETDGVDGLCLVGMSLLEGHIVRMPVRPGATFEIEALP
jgi:hypothetical protein